ncbi:sine oculis-binding protein homolog A isoform X2 [Contarinia nasturtii]|uniref:sine oculis-binding protein homolog A isoform X2 n=1 Tax=Contarinia nasturtii TaxID=265458 RepID=UPI0012D45489|nr:sine oculis-binding protein homolog A isoform X2 [Contarinia nasturtii]
MRNIYRSIEIISYHCFWEYAESAMNELLGWYGYNSNSNNDQSTERFNSLTNTRMSTPNFAQCLSQSTTGGGSGGASACLVKNGKLTKSLSMDDIDDTTDSMSAVDELAKMSPQMNKDGVTTAITDITSEKSPLRSHTQYSDECGWCKRVIPIGSSEFSATSEGLKFCSESCFSQSRRSAYKQKKTCDWCKHIRHAVSYVDFQDGASQLQFCSDKCLNQYKMQIFCKETQAHLDLNPHLKDTAKSSNENLITPELWMRNCRSRSLTPDQRSNDSRTTTESPITITVASTNTVPTIKVAPASKLLLCDRDTIKRQSRDESTTELKNYSHFTTQKTRTLRKRRTNQRLSSNSSSIISNLSENTNNNDNNNENRNIHAKLHHSSPIEKNRINNLLQPSMMSSMPAVSNISPSSLATVKNPQIDDPSATAFLQRYQLMSQQGPPPPPPPTNFITMSENRSLQNALRQSAPFIAPLISNHGYPDGGHHLSPHSYPTEPMQIPLTKLLPMQPQRQQRVEPSSTSGTGRKPAFVTEHNPIYFMQQHQKSQALNDFVSHVFGTVTPPSTILMPYPVILPIPIPLPIEAFLKVAELRKLPNDKPNSNGQQDHRHSHSCTNDEESHDIKANSNDQPLDFTKDTIRNEEFKLTDDESDNEDANATSSANKNDAGGKGDTMNKFRVCQQSIKRAGTFTKDQKSENNRPLRKRKRIIDCDYMRLKDVNCNSTSNDSKKSIQN